MAAVLAGVAGHLAGPRDSAASPRAELQQVNGLLVAPTG